LGNQYDTWPLLGEPVRHLADAHRERGDPASDQRTKNQQQRVGAVHRVRVGGLQQDEQPDHADVGDQQQDEERPLAAEPLDRRAKRDSQQRTGQCRDRRQHPRGERGQVEKLFELRDQRPEDRDAGKPSEEAERGQPQRLVARASDLVTKLEVFHGFPFCRH